MRSNQALRLLSVVGLTLIPSLGYSDALVGAAVGNIDTLITEGTRLYNEKKYAKAVELFTQATRASPTMLSTYLQLARSHLAAKQVARSCYVYRMYLKASPDSVERKKAQAESDQCERQLKNMKQQPDLSAKYVELRASFFTALDNGHLLEKGGAYENLKALVKDGFMGPELADMAQKLGNAAQSAADDIHRRALAHEKLSIESLKSVRALYQVAWEVSLAVPHGAPAAAFCDGLAALQSRDTKKAETLFAEAARQKPDIVKEYTFYRAVALYQAGDKKGALAVLDSDLKDDPRTEVLRTSLALSESAENGAIELERLLFSRRYPADK